MELGPNSGSARPLRLLPGQALGIHTWPASPRPVCRDCPVVSAVLPGRDVPRDPPLSTSISSSLSLLLPLGLKPRLALGAENQTQRRNLGGLGSSKADIPEHACSLSGASSGKQGPWPCLQVPCMECQSPRLLGMARWRCPQAAAAAGTASKGPTSFWFLGVSAGKRMRTVF